MLRNIRSCLVLSLAPGLLTHNVFAGVSAHGDGMAVNGVQLTVKTTARGVTGDRMPGVLPMLRNAACLSADASPVLVSEHKTLREHRPAYPTRA